MRKHKPKFHPASETFTSAATDAMPATSKRDTELSGDWDHGPEVMLDFSDTGSFSPSNSVETDKSESSDERVEPEPEKTKDDDLSLGRTNQKKLINLNL